MTEWMIDLLLGLTYLMILAALVATAFSVVKTIRLRNKGFGVHNGIPAARIAYGVGGFVAAVLLVTFLLGSSEPLVVNGQTYDDRFWLKAVDMFIDTSLVLIIVCFAVVAAGKFRR